MPEWLARLVVVMFDGQTEDAAMTWAGRFGQQMARWHAFDSAAWERVRESFCLACVADAKQSVSVAAAAVYCAVRATCWTWMANALCDLIDAELAAEVIQKQE
jgi:hypothetical protein